MPEEEAPKSLGRYQIVRELGKGAMGVVYEGVDPNIGRKVAIKTARRDVMETTGRADELMARFLREARAAGALNHANIVTIYDADEEHGIAYIAMEYIEGSDLRDRITQKQRFAPEEVVDIVAPICNALAAAHEQGIIHRDVKPANIMLLSDGTVKVTDFGIARVSDSELTQEGTLMGTPYYMSPEQFMGQKVDGRSDLFSVGVMVYEMTTGEKPFTGEAFSTIMHSVIKVQPIEPKELNFAVNDCFNQVVMKALHKRPDQRYQTGAAMAAALIESLKENPDPDVTGVLAAGAEQEETLVSNPEAATVVSAATPNATVPSATLPGAEAQVPEATVERIEPQAGATPRRKAPLLVFAGTAALVLVAAVLFAILSGGRGKPPGDTKPPPLPPPEPSVAKLIVTVHLANTQAAWEAATDGDFSKCLFGEKADVTVRDNKTQEVLAEEKGIFAEALPLATASPMVDVEIAKDGYATKALTVLPQKGEPNETCNIEVALKKLEFDAAQ